MNRYREKIKIDEEQLYGRLHIDGDSPADRLARKLLPELKQMAEENMNLEKKPLKQGLPGRTPARSRLSVWSTARAIRKRFWRRCTGRKNIWRHGCLMPC